MTPQQLKAMKMALEALKTSMYPQQKQLQAITALEEALAEHAMRETQRLGQEIEQEPVAIEYWLQDTMESGRWVKTDSMAKATAEKMLSGEYGDVFPQGRIAPPPQRAEQEPLELCKYGQEPASCTSNPMDCQCAIDAASAQPEQEPVAWMDADGNVSDNNDHKCFPIPLYTKEQP